MVLNRACSLHRLPSIPQSVLEECKSNYVSIVVQFMILILPKYWSWIYYFFLCLIHFIMQTFSLSLQRLNYFLISEICTPMYCKSYWVSNDTPVKLSEKDLIKLFKNIILQTSKSTAWPLGSLKPSILRLWESKMKKEFTHHILAKLNPRHVDAALLHSFLEA